MDHHEKPFQYASSGNSQALRELLAKDPSILERMALAPHQDTLLHVAVMHGEAEVAKEIMRRKPEYVSDSGKDGYSPIHIAAAKGDGVLLREMLKVDGVSAKVGHLKDWEGRTPLHLAAMKGRVDVMGDLLLACRVSGGEATTTPRGQTVLHLMVEFNQVEAFRVMLQDTTFHQMLNAKDQDGNTVLHLAVWKKRVQIVELLLSSNFQAMVEVNARNSKNLTALDLFDIVFQSTCDMSYYGVGRLLMRAGTVKITDSDHRHVNDTPLPSSKDDHNEEIDRASSETRSILMVVAVLIATVTFEAGLNPPGGFWQENSTVVASNYHHRKIHYRLGAAIMAYRPICYPLFIVFNTTGFLTSLAIIAFLTSRFPLKPWLRLAVTSMVCTYACGLCFITPFHRWGLGRSLHIQIFIPLLFFGALISWKLWWLKKCATQIMKRYQPRG